MIFYYLSHIFKKGCVVANSAVSEYQVSLLSTISILCFSLAFQFQCNYFSEFAFKFEVSRRAK